MRSGKDESKQMDPLFPRLHINETEKGGPRAPPRNKMALCEEISRPSQRPSGSVTMHPLPLSKDSSLDPSGSPSHVGCSQKSRFDLFCNWPGSSEFAEGRHSYSSSFINFETRLTNTEIQTLKPGNYQKFSSMKPSKMIGECHLFRPFNFYNSENSSGKTLGNEDNSRMPYFSQVDKTLHSGDNGDKLENKNLTSSRKNQTTSGRREKEMKITHFKLKEHLGYRTDDNHEVSQMREENGERPFPLSIGKKILADAAANQLTRNTTSDSSSRASTYQARDNLVNDKIKLHDACEQSHQVSRPSLENTASTDDIYEKVEQFSRKRSYSIMEAQSSSSGDLGENNRTLSIKESGNECPAVDNDLEVGDAIAISGTSVVDSKSGFSISADDVAGVMGPKLFWKLRRTIAHQQRIFAVQIFELHRLIKVQRLVAKSPEILSEDILHISEPSSKCSLVKKVLTPNIPEATSSSKKPKVDSQRPNLSPETAAKDAPECDSDKGHFTPRSILRPCSGASSTSSHFSTDVRLWPWYFHPGNQWLVPVRSHSEGLVYKPYTGPCPPMLNCIASVYGNFGTPSLNRRDRNFQSTTCSIPTSSQHGACFQPYAMPVVDTSNSSKSLPASKESAIHGNALSLFPINNQPSQTPYMPLPCKNTEMQRRMQVIKVVPHNPKLACESAARIFKSIQEERQRHN